METLWRFNANVYSSVCALKLATGMAIGIILFGRITAFRYVTRIVCWLSSQFALFKILDCYVMYHVKVDGWRIKISISLDIRI